MEGIYCNKSISHVLLVQDPWGMCACSSCVRLFVTLSLARLLRPWDSPGKSTGAGCHFLLQGIYLTHGSNLNLSPTSPALAGRFFTTATPISKDDSYVYQMGTTVYFLVYKVEWLLFKAFLSSQAIAFLILWLERSSGLSIFFVCLLLLVFPGCLLFSPALVWVT